MLNITGRDSLANNHVYVPLVTIYYVARRFHDIQSCKLLNMANYTLKNPSESWIYILRVPVSNVFLLFKCNKRCHQFSDNNLNKIKLCMVSENIYRKRIE